MNHIILQIKSNRLYMLGYNKGKEKIVTKKAPLLENLPYEDAMKISYLVDKFARDNQMNHYNISVTLTNNETTSIKASYNDVVNELKKQEQLRNDHVWDHIYGEGLDSDCFILGLKKEIIERIINIGDLLNKPLSKLGWEGSLLLKESMDKRCDCFLIILRKDTIDGFSFKRGFVDKIKHYNNENLYANFLAEMGMTEGELLEYNMEKDIFSNEVDGAYVLQIYKLISNILNQISTCLKGLTYDQNLGLPVIINNEFLESPALLELIKKQLNIHLLDYYDMTQINKEYGLTREFMLTPGVNLSEL